MRSYLIIPILVLALAGCQTQPLANVTDVIANTPTDSYVMEINRTWDDRSLAETERVSGEHRHYSYIIERAEVRFDWYSDQETTYFRTIDLMNAQASEWEIRNRSETFLNLYIDILRESDPEDVVVRRENERPRITIDSIPAALQEEFTEQAIEEFEITYHLGEGSRIERIVTVVERSAGDDGADTTTITSDHRITYGHDETVIPYSAYRAANKSPRIPADCESAALEKIPQDIQLVSAESLTGDHPMQRAIDTERFDSILTGEWEPIQDKHIPLWKDGQPIQGLCVQPISFTDINCSYWRYENTSDTYISRARNPLQEVYPMYNSSDLRFQAALTLRPVGAPRNVSLGSYDELSGTYDAHRARILRQHFEVVGSDIITCDRKNT